MAHSTPDVEIVTTPSRTWLDANLPGCNQRFLVASPYVGGCFLELSKAIKPDVDQSLLTSTDLRSFAMGASDINALCSAADSGVEILSLKRLHAKAYVIDDSCALVTSANATLSGLTRNWECGVAFRSPALVKDVARRLLAGLGAPEAPDVVQPDELAMIRDGIKAIKPLLPSMPRIEELLKQEQEPENIEVIDKDALLDSFQGWTRLALEGVMEQAEEAFSMDALFHACRPKAQTEYPDNMHVRAKLRQQLQRLRDFGLVNFLGGGMYKKAFTLSY